MVTRVDKFLGGLGIDATDKFEVASNASVTIGNGTTTGNVTLGGNIVVGGTVDGRDVATDGTKLDGIESGATADQTAADIRGLGFFDTSNDGASSGLDADLLDGQHGSYYTGYTDTAISNLVASAPATLDTLNELAAALGDDANFSTTVTNSIATKLPLAGGTMTGNIVMSGAQTVDGRDLSADGTKLDGIESGATADQTASEILTLIKTVDGAGSGLDADLLDGISSASFLRSDTSDSITSGSLTLDAGNITINNGTNLQIGLNASDGSIEITRAAGGAFIDFKNTTAEDYDARLQESGGSINLNGNRILTTADEGSGNGLDADTLDGVQGASYLRSDTSDSFTSGTLTISGTSLRLNDGVEIEFGTGGGATDAQIAWSGTALEFDVTGGPLYLDMGNDNDFYVRDVNSSYALSFYVDVSAGNAVALNNVNANNGKLLEGGNALIPAGSIIMYGAASAPSGWYLCEGGAISRTTYADLFAVISTTYGVGDGSTTFNVPDFRDRAPYGASTFLLGSKTAGEVNASGQNSTGTGTSGSTGGSTVANTTGSTGGSTVADTTASGGPTTHTVTTSTTNSTTDKDVTNSITVVTGVSAHAAHTHTIPSLTVNGHTHSIPSLTVNGHTHSVPALTVTHPGVAVKFIIKT